MNDLLLFAAQNANAFFSTDIGKIVKAFLLAIGVIVVLMSIFKAAGKFLSGKGAGDGVKILMLGFVIAAFCFRPELINGLISLFGDLISSVTGSADKLVDGSGANTGGRR